jgi:RNA polymerase sigma factor for flagellar operon FliA
MDEVWEVFVRDRCPCHRRRLIEAYLPLVRQVAGVLKRRFPPHLDVEDFVSAGVLGLVRAIDLYEPGRATKFEAFASMHIRGAIIDDLRSQDWVPRSVRRRQRQVGGVIERLEEELGREPTEVELSEALGLSREEAQRVIVEFTSTRMESLDHLVGSFGEAFRDLEEPERSVEQVLLARIVDVIERLPPRERLALVLRFHHGLSMSSIAKVMGVSAQRAQRFVARGALVVLAAVRHEMREVW